MKIWVTFLVSLGLLAQDPTPTPAKQQPGRVIGELTAKEDAKLTVKSDTGAPYSVTLDDKTSFIRVAPGVTDLKKGTKIAFADLAVGDRVMARGPVQEEQKTVPAVMVIVMSRSDIEEKQKREAAEWLRRGSTGVVSGVKPDANEIAITQKVRGETKTVTLVLGPTTKFRRYAPDSIRFLDAMPSTLADLKTGDQLRVLGDKSEDGSRITAEDVVFGTFRTIPATVISYDAVAGELKVTDLDSKKPLIVKVSKQTSVKKLPEMMALAMARTLNPNATGAAGGAGMRSGAAAAGGQAPGGQGGQSGQARPGGPQGFAGGTAAGGQGAPGGAGGFPGGARGQGGFPGAGGQNGGMRGGDLSQMLERVPAFDIAGLKSGDALIISSTAGSVAGKVSAITILAGVEPILTAAPRSAGQINLGSWSLDTSAPQ